ncbi:response regulator [Paenibacillus sp. J5C_2022]|uniref:response regulator n=1 Tax=Paenibacillus sp. J5C2022 TaxID=2977129 RepID=UPI0021D0C1CF|nr:response regulator [Paenibacillus sp. J5C2022]MCU6711621.1 response regulator [Paenibacillus sp. J5C2022]
MIKAIIIDDDTLTLNGLERSVPWEKYGIEVAGTAVDGKEGLALIEKHLPELILTDIYMPVLDGIEMLKHIRSEGNTAEVIILSGYEDFKYAQSAVKLNVSDYISKPATIDEICEVVKGTADKIRATMKTSREEQELRELLESHLPETRKLVLKGLLEPYFSDTLFFQKASARTKLKFDGQVLTVVLLEYVVTRDRLDVKRSDLAKFTYAVKNIVDEMTESWRGVYLADVQQNVVTLIATTPSDVRYEHSRARVKRLAGELVSTIGSLLKLQVWAAIGTSVDSVHDVHRSYQLAMNLLAERETVSEKFILCPEEFEDVKPVMGASRRPVEHYQNLIAAVTEGQSSLVLERIDRLIRHLEDMEHKPSVSALREMAIHLTGMLTIGLFDQGVLLEDIHPQLLLYKELERISGLEDFQSWLQEVMLPASEEMNSRGSHKHKKTVDYMKRYVQAHYDEDITLDVMADKVFLTRNYLSQIFKQVTGENYNSYVTRIRMEKAKELLLSGKYKLYEVALMVGYKNNAYFSQQFKKYAGCNPSDFA